MAKRRRHHEDHEEHENHERWLITYADMITLLMVLFIVLYAISQVDLAKFGKLRDGLQESFGSRTPGVLDGGEGVLNGNPEGNVPGDAAEIAAPASAVTESDSPGISAVRAERNALDGAAEQIRSELAVAGLSDAVRFRLEARGLVVSVATDRVLFTVGDAMLQPSGREVLDHLAGALAKLPNRIGVEGHTDDTPIVGGIRYPTNWELSTARATSVLRYLAERHGIAQHRLAAAGYADQRPLAPNATTAGRAANRRVEIVVFSNVKLTDEKEAA